MIGTTTSRGRTTMAWNDRGILGPELGLEHPGEGPPSGFPTVR